ncbi:MAG: peptide deformylase [Candidatus Kapaibacterium sp.]
MILPVYLYNHPVLRTKAAPVDDMSDELRTFIENMYETMRNAEGIGLAANQVGSSHAVCIVDISETDQGEGTGPITLINPVIDAMSDAEDELEEGCLSVPTLRDIVVRPEAVAVRYMDEHMRERTLEADGLLARVLQHEIDHLNGIYFFERLSPVKKALNKSKLRRIERGQVLPEYEHVKAGA